MRNSTVPERPQHYTQTNNISSSDYTNTEIDEEQEKNNHELTLRKWRHRRRLAYISLIASVFLVTIVIVLAAFGEAGSLSDFNSVLVISISGFLSLVGAYMGLATWKE